MPCWFIKICLRPSASLTTIGPRARHPRDTRPLSSSSQQQHPAPRRPLHQPRRTTPSPTGIYNALSKVRPAGTACARHRAPPRHTKCAYGRTTLTNHADHKSRRHGRHTSRDILLQPGVDFLQAGVFPAKYQNTRHFADFADFTTNVCSLSLSDTDFGSQTASDSEPET